MRVDSPVAAEGQTTSGRKARLLFAGLTEEWIKGYHVLRDACDRLWRERQDFELVVTDRPKPGGGPPSPGPAVRFVGWLSQADLPAEIRRSDILVVPTVAQEALGRTAVEAMAAGRPVVASRIGGLPFTVQDGLTGLLAEPGDAADLAAKIRRLLDDPELRTRMGRAGRAAFEERFTWGGIIERHYKPLLQPRRSPCARRPDYMKAGAPAGSHPRGRASPSRPRSPDTAAPGRRRQKVVGWYGCRGVERRKRGRKTGRGARCGSQSFTTIRGGRRRRASTAWRPCARSPARWPTFSRPI